MIGIYGLRVVIHFIGKSICFYLREEGYPTIKKFLNKVSKDLYYGQIIAISIEAYLEFLWMGYLALNYSGFKNNGDIISVFLGAVLEIIALGLLPMSFFYMFA